MTERHTPTRRTEREDRRRSAGARKPYEAPRLIDYGRISKLTETGGITTKDQGNMFRQGP
ncbi:MAG: hypothetical protein DMF84_03250 [Acidobacteria bacterium]|nr:MAG: hypothetical protein DMF84_03250 [Acidobacteriota bacterium]